MAEATREITGLGFFKLGALLADVPKTINYLQNYGVIPDGTRKNCAFCHAQDSVALHKNAKGHVPFVLRCSKCRKGDMYIFQFIYLHQQKNKGRTTPQHIFPYFLRDIASVYPGYGKRGLRPVEYSCDRKVEISDDL